jgi:hypothetical protein
VTSQQDGSLTFKALKELQSSCLTSLAFENDVTERKMETKAIFVNLHFIKPVSEVGKDVGIGYLDIHII